MKSNDNDSRRRPSRWKLRIIAVLIVFGFLWLILPTIIHQQIISARQPRPPDLSQCTRIEIEYFPSTLEYFFPGNSPWRLMNPQEIEDLRSIDKVIVNDEKAIKAFARQVSSGVYDGPACRLIGIGNLASISCYNDGTRIGSFTQIGDLIQTEDGHQFKCPKVRMISPTISPQIWRLWARVECAGNLKYLKYDISKFLRRNEALPKPLNWCDAIVQEGTINSSVSKNRMREYFKCSSAGRGKSNYALNPYCEPNSPPDVVLLFEMKAGWNQHGGPELFTFDNHDPKGGCVLLKDGTVKFIRTEEELQQLRWK